MTKNVTTQENGKAQGFNRGMKANQAKDNISVENTEDVEMVYQYRKNEILERNPVSLEAALRDNADGKLQGELEEYLRGLKW